MDFAHQAFKIWKVVDDDSYHSDDQHDDKDLDGLFHVNHPLLKVNCFANGQFGRLPSRVGARRRCTDDDNRKPQGHGGCR